MYCRLVPLDGREVHALVVQVGMQGLVLLWWTQRLLLRCEGSAIEQLCLVPVCLYVGCVLPSWQDWQQLVALWQLSVCLCWMVPQALKARIGDCHAGNAELWVVCTGSSATSSLGEPHLMAILSCGNNATGSSDAVPLLPT